MTNFLKPFKWSVCRSTCTWAPVSWSVAKLPRPQMPSPTDTSVSSHCDPPKTLVLFAPGSLACDILFFFRLLLKILTVNSLVSFVIGFLMTYRWNKFYSLNTIKRILGSKRRFDHSVLASRFHKQTNVFLAYSLLLLLLTTTSSSHILLYLDFQPSDLSSKNVEESTLCRLNMKQFCF